jgi:hypothetical protein
MARFEVLGLDADRELIRSPLVGADLNLKRPVMAGRKVDLAPVR